MIDVLTTLHTRRKYFRIFPSFIDIVIYPAKTRCQEENTNFFCFFLIFFQKSIAKTIKVIFYIFVNQLTINILQIKKNIFFTFL